MRTYFIECGGVFCVLGKHQCFKDALHEVYVLGITNFRLSCTGVYNDTTI
jgi:hypothetical protein